MNSSISTKPGFSKMTCLLWLAVSATAFGIDIFGLEVDLRDYHQVLPPPFAITTIPSRDYLKKQPPLSPWQTTLVQPDWRDVEAYQQKKDALARLVEEERKAKSGAAQAETGPASFGMRLDPTLPAPSIFSTSVPQPEMKAEVKPRPVDVPNVTVSPWLVIPSPAPQPQSAVTPNEENGAPKPEGPNGPAWIRKPAMGGSTDIYLPFSFTPGYTPPAPASAVIYSQPEAR